MDIIKSLIGDLVPEVLTWLSLMRVRDNWESIMAGGQVPMDTAYTQFMEAVQGEFQKARDMVVSDPEGVQFYTPPAIGHMMAIGMYPHNSLVSLKSVVTVMNYTELEKKT